MKKKTEEPVVWQNHGATILSDFKHSNLTTYP